jgi:hypothetical protein
MASSIRIAIAAAVFGVASIARGQGSANAALVVHVSGSLTVPGSDSLDVFGAGTIVAVHRDSLIVVTARHIVTPSHPKTDHIFVSVRNGGAVNRLPAALMLPQDSTLDLAVLIVPLPAGTSAPVTAEALHGYLGAPTRLEFAHPLDVVGCPAGNCRQRNAEPQLFEGLTVDEIVFHTTSIEKGNSGGALFNRWGEVVGMVITEGQARAHAVRMDVVIDQLKDLGIATQLDPTNFPRAGYVSTAGATVLVVGKQGHAPSARLTLDHQLGTMMRWYVGGMRLAPANLSLEAAVGGFSLDVRRGRVTLSPFAEGSIGQVDAQYDAGGHFVEDGSTTHYIPFWHSLHGSALGGGVGLSAEATVAPRLVIQGMLGKWRYSTPELSPALPRFAGGFGIRWSVNPR